MTTSATQTMAPTLAAATVPTTDASVVQLLLCQCSGQSFALRTDDLAGVYQLTPKQVEQGVQHLETAQGEFPIVALADLLSRQLKISLPVAPEDRSLLALKVGDELVALRTGSVSRPITISESAFNRLPNVAHPTDAQKIFSSVVVIDQEADSSVDALRLVFDPAVALGLKTRDASDVELTSAADVSQPAKSTAVNKAGNAGHLLVFMPEDSTDVGDFIFALPLAAVAEVTTAHEVLPVCMADENLEGYIYWRNNPVPVVRLGRSFGMADQHARADNDSTQVARRLVVTHTAGGQPVAFYAQTSMQSVRIPVAEAVAPDSLKDRPVLGAFRTEMGTLVVPDLDLILKAKA